MALLARLSVCPATALLDVMVIGCANKLICAWAEPCAKIKTQVKLFIKKSILSIPKKDFLHRLVVDIQSNLLVNLMVKQVKTNKCYTISY